jgi:hypothetical protein
MFGFQMDNQRKVCYYILYAVFSLINSFNRYLNETTKKIVKYAE